MNKHLIHKLITSSHLLLQAVTKVLGVLLVTVALMAHCSTAQTTHVVGGTTGWVPPSDPTFYATWASQQTFRVGDSLTFNFATSRHDVTTVTQAGYDACNASSPIDPVQTTSPVTISLTSAGPQYYLCSFDGHCSFGQKLSINVSAAGTPPPTPATTAPPPAVVATPPTTSAVPPTTSTVTPPPTSPATPPTVSATPPTTSATPPSPPTDGVAPPTTSATPPTAGGPPSNPASRLVAAGLSATFISFTVALLF